MKKLLLLTSLLALNPLVASMSADVDVDVTQIMTTDVDSAEAMKEVVKESGNLIYDFLKGVGYYSTYAAQATLDFLGYTQEQAMPVSYSPVSYNYKAIGDAINKTVSSAKQVITPSVNAFTREAVAMSSKTVQKAAETTQEAVQQTSTWVGQAFGLTCSGLNASLNYVIDKAIQGTAGTGKLIAAYPGTALTVAAIGAFAAYEHNKTMSMRSQKLKALIDKTAQDISTRQPVNTADLKAHAEAVQKANWSVRLPLSPLAALRALAGACAATFGGRAA